MTSPLRTRLALARASVTLLELRHRFVVRSPIVRKVYKPTQPRVPAGQTTGGQWMHTGKSPWKNEGKPSFNFGGLFGLTNAPPGGSAPEPFKPPKGAKPHPRLDDQGKPVLVHYPSKPSDPATTWHAKDKVATFVPGGDTPKSLMGVAMKPWKPPASLEGWAKVSGQDPALEAAGGPLASVEGKKIGAGVIIMEPDGRVWVTRPTNQFGGYEHTFPKGTVEDGLSLQASAIKEAYEETGLKVKLVGVLGDYERSTSVARYYVAKREGGTPAAMGWESQALRLAPQAKLGALLNKDVDHRIARHLEEIAAFKKAYRPDQPRWPAGSPLGGQWMHTGAGGFTSPPQIGGGAANPQYQKYANEIFALAQKGDIEGLKAWTDKLNAKVAASAAKAKQNSHDGWYAKLAQYATHITGQTNKAPVVEAKAAAIAGPEKLSSFTQIGPKPGGSNPGGLYTDAQGQTWLVKGNAMLVNGQVTPAVSDDRAKNEVLAAALINASGNKAPHMKLVDLEGKHGGGLGVASLWDTKAIPFDKTNPQLMWEAQKTFATHVLLANYDAVGMQYDNIKHDPASGQAIAVDPGGALLFRAQGLPKSGGLGAVPNEWNSMRDHGKNVQAASVFGKMTDAQLKESAAMLNNLSDDKINSLVKSYGPGDLAAKGDLAQKLRARRDAILGYAGLPAIGQTAKPPTPPPPPPQPSTQSNVPASMTATPMHVAAHKFPLPEFKTGFAHADATYKEMATKLKSAWVTGDGAKLNSTMQSLGLPSDPAHLSTAGKQIHGYHAALKADIDAKATAIAGQTGTPKSVAPNPAVPQPGTAAKPNLPAMPDFAKAKIPESNSNASSHNSKIDTISTLASSGNASALLALGFGTNTYGKKQAAVTNDALAALGSPHKVTAGQKKGQHPSFTGHIQQQQSATATASLAESKAAKVHTVDHSKLPGPPDFNTMGPGGKPLSSKPEQNEANNKEAHHLLSLAKQPNGLEALKAYGEPPSKHNKQYKADLISNITDQLNPPEPLKVLDHFGGNVADIGSLVPLKYAVGTSPSAIPTNQKIGWYVALGVVKTNSAWSDGAALQAQSWVDEGYVSYKKLSNASKVGINAAQGSAHTMREKPLTHTVSNNKGTSTVGEIHAAWKKEASEVPAGTKLYRYMNITPSMQQKFLAAEQGTVVADLSPMATSRDNGRNTGFGSSKIEFIALPGVKAMKSFGSTRFQGEMETTTLFGQRFMIHKVRKRANGHIKIKAYLLPTDVS